jgi:3-deoxy-7-phosphoheptulonate synthase
MLESNLVAGRQDLPAHFGRDSSGLRYGQSITDACIDLMATETCLESLARAAKKRAPQASD